MHRTPPLRFGSLLSIIGAAFVIRIVRPVLERMQSYRVMVHGENLLTEVDGTRQRLGFYTHVVVEAFTLADAESMAVDAIRDDVRLRDLILNADDDPVRLSTEETREVESGDKSAEERTGFMLYPEEEK
jgi:hypothetical protein